MYSIYIYRFLTCLYCHSTFHFPLSSLLFFPRKFEERREGVLSLADFVSYREVLDTMGKERELWDDSALIKAFDSAISKYKVILFYRPRYMFIHILVVLLIFVSRSNSLADYAWKDWREYPCSYRRNSGRC